ncbi:hypothetical protein MTR67_007805 [Solanum verrucosum]|uniref:Endonuclease/exonuclease/phosphatase domain-containing protein n=1 Tax=Solanum verrucosum TaxID=315347 RepID=A0AAF0Q2N1_SOLVR|nr:hypothetical protein MTR67_007805 [Solanum verrucosum]
MRTCWHLSAIYADCNRVARRALWQELLVLKNSLNGPWIVCGDFNITRYPSGKTNCHRLSGAMEEFSSCIEELQLVDPPLLGGSFTWRRGEDHSCASRIDRILHCAEWGDNFTHIKQSCLPKMASDHNPIILSCGGEEWKKSYFKFEIWWLEVEGFKDRVKEWWASFQVNGRPGYILAEKLKMLKVKLKEWSKVNRGNWKQRKEDILNQISKWETVQEQRPLTDDELIQKTHLAMEFEEVVKKEEIAWKQRSRIQWLKHGDKNTKNFHRIATSHKRFNSLEQLEVDGATIKDPDSIKNAVQKFCEGIYKETEQWRPGLRLHDVSRITEEGQIWLQRPFEEEEIMECLKQCAMEKAPGPDGFPMVFLQTFWGILKEDIINTIKVFHSKQTFEEKF